MTQQAGAAVHVSGVWCASDLARIKRGPSYDVHCCVQALVQEILDWCELKDAPAPRTPLYR